jgi:hypothetical protein
VVAVVGEGWWWIVFVISHCCFSLSGSMGIVVLKVAVDMAHPDEPCACHVSHQSDGKWMVERKEEWSGRKDVDVASINALGKCRALKERCATRSRTCY